VRAENSVLLNIGKKPGYLKIIGIKPNNSKNSANPPEIPSPLTAIAVKLRLFLWFLPLKNGG
jgi:hypothetical protein